MASPTTNAVETLTGLGGTGIEVVLMHIAESPVPAHPMIPVIQVSNVEPVIARFYRSIRERSEPPVTAEKGRRVVELIDRVWPPTLERVPAGEPAAFSTRRASPPSVLVTGASGFIGIHLVRRALEEGLAVRAMVRPGREVPHLEQDGVRLHEADLLDESSLFAACRGAAALVHCAARMGFWSRQDEEQHREARDERHGSPADPVDPDAITRSSGATSPAVTTTSRCASGSISFHVRRR